MTKSRARLLEVMVSWVAIKISCLDSWSTTTRSEVQPKDRGSCSMKLMEIEVQGYSGTGSCFSKPYGLCHHGLA